MVMTGKSTKPDGHEYLLVAYFTSNLQVPWKTFVFALFIASRGMQPWLAQMV